MIQKIISVVFQWNLNFDTPTAEALGLSRRLLVKNALISTLFLSGRLVRIVIKR